MYDWIRRQQFPEVVCSQCLHCQTAPYIQRLGVRLGARAKFQTLHRTPGVPHLFETGGSIGFSQGAWGEYCTFFGVFVEGLLDLPDEWGPLQGHCLGSVPKHAASLCYGQRFAGFWRSYPRD